MSGGWSFCSACDSEAAGNPTKFKTQSKHAGQDRSISCRHGMRTGCRSPLPVQVAEERGGGTGVPGRAGRLAAVAVEMPRPASPGPSAWTDNAKTAKTAEVVQYVRSAPRPQQQPSLQSWFYRSRVRPTQANPNSGHHRSQIT